jgi:hypothetical protein
MPAIAFSTLPASPGREGQGRCSITLFFPSCPTQDIAAYGKARYSRSSMTGDNGVACIFGEIVMKTIVSALIALSVLAGVAAPANAFDAKTLYEQLDRQSH